MIHKHSVQSLAAGLALAATVAFISVNASGKETKMNFDNLPEQVRTTATSAVGKGKIESVTSEMEGKRMTYEVAVSEDGQKHEYKFSAKGKLLESEAAVAPADLPAPVRTAIAQAAGSDKILETVRVTAGDKKYYEADIAEKGGVREVKVSDEGKVLATTHEKTATDENVETDEGSEKKD